MAESKGEAEGHRDGFGGDNRRSPLGNGCGASFFPWAPQKSDAIPAETDDHYAGVREEPEGRTLPLLTVVARRSALRTELQSEIEDKDRCEGAPMRKARNETIRK